MSLRTEFEMAREKTGTSVDGTHIDSRSVQISETFGNAIGSSLFRLSIGKTILIHELQQSGVEIDTDTVDNFVQEDLRTHQAVAASGYLRIVQAVDRSKNSTGVLTSLFKKQSLTANWQWCSVDSVRQIDDTVVISGFASSTRVSPGM